MSSDSFEWKCHPKAENLVLSLLNEALEKNSFIQTLSHQLEKETSTRLFDWLDHIAVSHSDEMEKELKLTGFTLQEGNEGQVYAHKGAQLPRVVLQKNSSNEKKIQVAVSVERIADFLNVRGLSRKIEGSPLSGYRRALIEEERGVSLFVVERRATLTLEPTFLDSKEQEKILIAEEIWMTRPRALENETQGLEKTLEIVNELVSLVGQDMAAWIVLKVERKYWQAKNRAGQFQKNRQDHLGMGWANHDHHTFRSSRKYFLRLIHIFELLGFRCRERYYAGSEAGFGAQVMENSVCRLVLFLDVDLLPDEVDIDYARQQLPEINKLGTIGLWTALHGESILKGGMHHLEAQFLFEKLTDDLKGMNQGMMTPFSSFPFLKQAFTEGEVWQVSPERVNEIFEKGLISKEARDKFIHYGAIGSHLENLQRREGYKGFNQKNVSRIIKDTDPRNIVDT